MYLKNYDYLEIGVEYNCDVRISNGSVVCGSNFFFYVNATKSFRLSFLLQFHMWIKTNYFSVIYYNDSILKLHLHHTLSHVRIENINDIIMSFEYLIYFCDYINLDVWNYILILYILYLLYLNNILISTIFIIIV